MKETKRTYEQPEMEVMPMVSNVILCASGGNTGGGGTGEVERDAPELFFEE